MTMAVTPPNASIPKLWTLTSRTKRTIARKQADAPEDAGKDGAGMRELEVEPEEPDHEKDVGEVRVRDGQEEPLTEGHGQRHDRLVLQGQPGLPAVEPPELAAVEEGDDIAVGLGHEVDQAAFEGLLLGIGEALDDGVLSHADVSSPFFGQGLDVGGGVVRDLVLHGLVQGLPRDRQADGVRGSRVGPGRHGEDVTGDPDEEARRSGPGAAGGHVADHGRAGVDDLSDDVPHRTVQPPRRVESHEDKGVALLVGPVDGADDVFGRDGLDRAVDGDLENGSGGEGRKGREKEDQDFGAHSALIIGTRRFQVNTA
jgi:hypothetical protein